MRPGSQTPGQIYRGPSKSTAHSEWEYSTPRVNVAKYEENYPIIHDPSSSSLISEEISKMTEADFERWSEEQKQVDRNWYDVSEDGAVDLEHSSMAEMEYGKEAVERKNIKKVSLRQAHFNKESEMWETNRMLQSGVVQRTTSGNEVDDENEEGKVHLMVHDIKPPFLDGRTVFTKQLDAIQPVRDPTSDMAKFARNGSQLVKEMREKKEISKAMKALDGTGTTLGNVMGKQQSHKAELIEKVTQKLNETEEFRKENKFATHLKSGEANSVFSKTKSIKEQREFLPAFSVRNDLLRVVRDNQSKEFL
jgi:pre-mRNA-splicing factor ATP-dependent RNA helicase DHX38/PRP16